MEKQLLSRWLLPVFWPEGTNYQEKMRQKNLHTKKQAERDENEELENENRLLEEDNLDLREEIKRLREDNRILQDKLQEISDLKMIQRTRINLSAVQKDLLSQGINKDSDDEYEEFMRPEHRKKRKATIKKPTVFKDVLNFQLKVNQKHQLVARCAYQWLNQTRKKKSLRGED